MRIASLKALLSRLGRDRRGNVLLLVAFSIVPLVLATGVGIDYSRAARLQTRLNAAADAAALAAVTQPMMKRTEADARAAATNMFNAQVKNLPGLIYDPADLKVDIAAGTPGTTNDRTVTVSYSAQSVNSFAGILGMKTIAIGGSSQSNAIAAPNIDFYLLLDTSPSMLLPSTSAGLKKMRELTNCAFACHLSQPHDEGIYVSKQNVSTNLPNCRNPLRQDVPACFDGSGNVKFPDGTFADSYWLAQNKGITMRIDAEQVAVRDLMDVAKDMAQANEVTYRMAVSRFDYAPNFKTVATLTTDLDSIKTSATGLPITRWYKNSYITSSKNIDDKSSEFLDAFKQMDSLMPDPGNGSADSTPQEILFIITDGMSDEDIGGGRTHRELQKAHIDKCNAIKARGIRIAILYTEYLPESLEGNAWSQTNVKPYLDKVEPALRSCASPGLLYTVTTDDDISAALAALFRQAVATAHLVQ
ncbi:MAG TPA: pilus assembly protein TadG-related protein [Sphingomonadaceae bacterium]|nr:pilus assembly protein TadG-related protein [Sphingomonadaceae bacterium]